MKKRLIIGTVILLVILLLPDSSTFSKNEYGWKFWNWSYSEFKRDDGEWICFDAMPLPRRAYAYRSLFLDLRLGLDYCEQWENHWMDNGFSIFIGVEEWGDYDLYLPLVWIMISDGTDYFDLLGGGRWKIGENYIDLWEQP